MISIIIVTFNSESTIERCLSSVISFKPEDADVIVVDNCSTDKTVEIVKKFSEVKFIQSAKNCGFGEGNNIAMRASDADYYYLHNSDAYLTKDALNQVREAMESDKTIGIGGLSMIYPNGDKQTSSYSFSSPLKWTLQVIRADKFVKLMLRNSLSEYILRPLSKSRLGRSFLSTHSDNSCKGTVVNVDWVCGAGMMISRRAYELTKGFDSNIFLYSEDEDICLRVYQAGMKCVLVHVENPVTHDHGWHSKGKRSSYSPLKYNSKKFFIDKHFSGLRNKIMHFLLYIKWRVNVD